jgi:phenylacetic acid degradation operon negative regulatory protein
VAQVLAAHGQPTAWSVIMTVFGDAVAPRGGSLWTGNLLEILGLLGFNGGVLRTALSRLVADGWLAGSKDGRKSYYSLTTQGREAAQAASERIYRLGPPRWDGTWDIVLPLAKTAQRNGLRRQLAGEGFGVLPVETFLRPRTGRLRPILPSSAVLLEGARAPDEISDRGARLAERAWPLAETAEHYARLERVLAPVLRVVAQGERLGEADALAARLLLVHEMRRVVLRDPDLPVPLLPADWIGTRVRRDAGAAYRRLLEPSERWLDAHGQSDCGSLPAAGKDLKRRFAG